MVVTSARECVERSIPLSRHPHDPTAERVEQLRSTMDMLKQPVSLAQLLLGTLRERGARQARIDVAETLLRDLMADYEEPG